MLQGTFAASAIATYKLHSVQWNKVQTQMVDKKDRTRILECCIMRPHEITVPASWVHSWPEQKVTTPCICSNSDKRGSGTSIEYLRKMEKETHILSFTWTQRAVDTCMNRNAGNGTWQYVIKSKKIHNNYTCLQDICLHRLVVRTSRCGRDNPGSNPGGDIYHILAHACMGHPTLSIWRFPKDWSLWNSFMFDYFSVWSRCGFQQKTGYGNWDWVS